MKFIRLSARDRAAELARLATNRKFDEVKGLINEEVKKTHTLIDAETDDKTALYIKIRDDAERNIAQIKFDADTAKDNAKCEIRTAWASENTRIYNSYTAYVKLCEKIETEFPQKLAQHCQDTKDTFTNGIRKAWDDAREEFSNGDKKMPKFTLAHGVLGFYGAVREIEKQRQEQVDDFTRQIEQKKKDVAINYAEGAEVFERFLSENKAEIIDMMKSKSPVAAVVLEQYMERAAAMPFSTGQYEKFREYEKLLAHRTADLEAEAKDKFAEEINVVLNGTLANWFWASVYMPRVVIHAGLVVCKTAKKLATQSYDTIKATRKKMAERPKLVYPEFVV
ncbi:MAG: hypothetical protein WC464_07895 [Bdellovibrionales bacterium]